MIKKIIFAVMLGIVSTLYIMQSSCWVKQQVGNVLKDVFDRTFGCCLSCTVESVNFFVPELVLAQVSVYPHDPQEQWSWQAEKYTMSFSWWQFFCTRARAMGLWITLDHVNLFSGVRNNTLTIMSHIHKLVDPPQLAVITFIKSLLLKDTYFHIVDEQRDYTLSIGGSGQARCIDESFKVSWHCTSGDLVWCDQEYITDIGGTITCDIAGYDGQSKIQVNGIFELPHLQGMNTTCIVTGKYAHGSGLFSIRNLERSLMIEPLIINSDGIQSRIQCNAYMPLTYVHRVMAADVHNDRVQGSCELSMQGEYGSVLECDLSIQLKNIIYNKNHLCEAITLEGALQDLQWQGLIAAHLYDDMSLQGSWHWNMNNNDAALYVNNETVCEHTRCGLWKIMPGDGSLQIAIDNQGSVQADCTVTAKHDVHADMTLKTTLVMDNKHTFSLHGSCGTYIYDVEGGLLPTLHIDTLSCVDCNNVSMITCDTKSIEENQPLQALKGNISYSFIRSLLENFFNLDVQGTGTFQVQAKKYTDYLEIGMHLHDGTIRLPKTYNFIDGFDVQLLLNWTDKSIMVRNMHCSLHTGTLDCPSAVFYFNDAAQCTYMHVPILYNHCLLNLHRDLFTMISGSLLIQKEHYLLPLIKGSIILDRSQLKENIFSEQFQKQLFQFTSNLVGVQPFDMYCDVNIETKYPIRIDTALLKSNAAANVHITGSLSDPEVGGYVRLLSGKLMFPYKALSISKGSIYFLPHQLSDPLVELVAHNKIKKYEVSLYVTGSLQNHHVILESTPSLSEEQVIALLLVGSEQSSLNMVMPALLVQNLKHILFGSNQSSLLDPYFNRSVKPFAITLVPSFIDQTGRGGLRGAVEIYINERWRAMIQKNFSLSEDTRFELEYAVSDDVSLRAIRDERRDIGAQVEMRWKF